ncbi:unnamed protein product, partial [Enterobius vermicularis]|uniref:S-protein homolog n=1 Tax=Enterobius vermicularis TaxID=51028 RepID=A0A0N4VDB8_ENTVE
RLRCQSILTDLRDQFIDSNDQFQFHFHDFDFRNQHFWCDIAGLNSFYEHFDVFGGMAPKAANITWVLDDDGLYINDSANVYLSWWGWQSFH